MDLKNKKIAETKSCQQCQVSFDIFERDLEFYDKVSPVFVWKKYSIPSPRLCFTCRHQRRLTWRNERKLYKWICNKSWKEMISIYTPDSIYTIYEQSIWWSDSWNSMDYWIGYDFKKNFFEQFHTLNLTVPKCSILNWGSTNSEYTNQSQNNKNCYFLTSSWYCEDSFYSHWLKFSHNSMDCLQTGHSDHCYECTNVEKVYNSSYIEDCEIVSDSMLLYDCKNTDNSIACSWLRNKKNYFLNKQVSAEEVKSIKAKIQSSYIYFLEIQSKYQKLKGTMVRKYIHWEKIQNATGDYVYDAKNAQLCFNNFDIEDVTYSFDSLVVKDSLDLTEVYQIQQGYELHGWNDAFKSAFCSNFKNNINCYYCFFSTNLSDCFGCIGLRNKIHCIFNTQYSQTEYETLVPKIIQQMITDKQWWEFPPSNTSVFGYNDSTAQEYFLLDKIKAEEQWFNWSDYTSPPLNVEKTIPANKLPDDTVDIPDDILNWAIKCEVTDKPFRITAQELEFYRKHKLPIPRKHPDQRHLDRMSLRNPRKIFERACDKCSTEMKTTYSPERLEKIYCESCYNKEIY